ncbi:hypothetical protein Ate01nite_21630 [Actinoplanes teichomyceticus]|nr:hypothetical protein Ate01nite_21630 [Actinoplanes teichomyceticus]
MTRGADSARRRAVTRGADSARRPAVTSGACPARRLGSPVRVIEPADIGGWRTAAGLTENNRYGAVGEAKSGEYEQVESVWLEVG